MKGGGGGGVGGGGVGGRLVSSIRGTITAKPFRSGLSILSHESCSD